MKKIMLALAMIGASMTAVSPASAAYDRHVRINNYANQNIFEVHISNVGDNNWHRDLLDRDEVIHARHSMLWNVDDGTGSCRFDFKVVMEDGTERYKYNYNVCAETHLDVTS